LAYDVTRGKAHVVIVDIDIATIQTGYSIIGVSVSGSESLTIRTKYVGEVLSMCVLRIVGS
jgi:hypothetical protein